MAQVASVMDDYKLHCLAVTETRWRGTGETTLQSKHSIIYSGNDKTHTNGVTFMMTPSVRKSLTDWMPVNERLMCARLREK